MIDGVLPHDMAERAREKGVTDFVGVPDRVAVPLGPRVLVEPITEPTSELLVEDITGSTPTRGEVYAVGDEVTKVKVGDEVFFKQYAGVEIEIANREMLIFQENDLLMVWR